MKKMTAYASKLLSIKESLDNLIGDLEEARDAIEDKALDHDRDMTEKEQERYDLFDEQIDNVNYAIDSIDEALSYIEEYC